LKRQLPNLPQRSRKTVARCHTGEAPRQQRKKKNKTKSKKEAAAPKSMQRRVAKRGSEQRPVVVGTTSDYSDSSSQSSTLVGFVHGSDHEQDSQTSIGTESDNDFD
jgi:hypothetical protein